MRKRIVILTAVFLCVIGWIFYVFSLHIPTQDEIRGVAEFGPLKLGEKTPQGGPGDWTFAPLFEIPVSHFYVAIAHTDRLWCSNESCSLDGALIETLGGWLQVATTQNFPDLPSIVGFDKEENKQVQSIALVAERDGRLVGIYPNRGLLDVLPILRLHPDLADFSLLEGVQEFGILKVGEPAPLQSGDSLARFGDTPPRHNLTHVPKGKKFYLFSVQKRKYDIVGKAPEPYESHPSENTYQCYYSGCRYPEPDPPHDFLFAYVDDLGGWFFSADEEFPALSELFGLDHEAVLRGDSSLVVLTDSQGIIRALHPGKTLADTFTILSQHPDLANLEKFYRQ